MDNLKLLYPDADIIDNKIIIKITNDVSAMFNIDIENHEYIAWDSKGQDHTDKLTQAIADIKIIQHKPEDKLILILQSFRDSFGKIAGFETTTIDENDIDLPTYDGTADKLWSVLKSKFNVDTNRKLKIYTYGTIFLFDAPKDCQRIFNSSILRGSHANLPEKYGLSYKSLLKLRGTSLKVQQEVRGAELYKTFIEEVVSAIETENLHTIGIICRAGHHRSVSCAEMLLHLYPNRTVDHLTMQL